MMRRTLLGAVVASLGLIAVLSSQAYAAFPNNPSNSPAALDPANHGQWDENGYYNGFGGALPPGIVEGSTGFSTIGNYDGRTVGLASVTTNKLDSQTNPLTTISTNLFSGTDVNLYEIAVTNPATFSASVPSTTLLLALFSSNGTALSASIGTTLNASNDGITSPGLYYVGLADSTTPGLFPSNAAGNLLFGAPTTPGAFTPVVLSDMTLASDPGQAWASSTGAPTSPLLSNTSFLAGGSTISLTGSQFAVVPEPASMSLLGIAGLGLLGRRRRSAAR